MLTRIATILAGVVAFWAMVWATYQYGFEAGKRHTLMEVREAAIAARAENVQNAKELRDEVDNLPDDDLRDRLGEWLLRSEDPGSD